MEVCTAEFADAHPELQGSRLGLVSASVRQWLERGRGMSREERAEASMRREAIRAWFAERLEEHDALLVPTTPFAAPRIDAETVDLGSSGTVQLSTVGPGYLTCSVNLAGLPAVNLPAGRSGRLPVGVSLVGRPGGESVVLEMARVWERATEHSPARPPLPRP
jgi:aspartyl-tRNA(Asn)/glutamyl-tRNA(Gln) amidotransferase subunit A